MVTTGLEKSQHVQPYELAEGPAQGNVLAPLNHWTPWPFLRSLVTGPVLLPLKCCGRSAAPRNLGWTRGGCRVGSSDS